VKQCWIGFSSGRDEGRPAGAPRANQVLRATYFVRSTAEPSSDSLPLLTS
jgi:hypothetical protein